jgi:branched-chain amino acid transport system substrate-binding protein
MDSAVPPRRRRLLSASGALALAVALAACSAPGSGGSSSSGGGGGGGGGLPGTVKVMDINGLTGPVAFAGTNARKGTELAIEQIEKDGLLGSTKIQVDFKDAAADPQQAASLASQAIADPSYAAILGPSASAQATAVSPIVQQAGMPTIYVQAGSDGVLVGDATYRLTPPAASYYGIVGDYLSAQGIEDASILYNAGNPTLAQLGTDTVPALLEDKGVATTGTASVDVTAQDFTTSASQIAEEDPDAAFLLLTGPQYPVAINQLKQAGFTGEIIGFSAMGAGNLTSSGQTAAGAVWPTNFTVDQSDEGSKAFVAAYEAKYNGEQPNNYAAEAYDRTWFLARALAEAKSADRAAIVTAMKTVAGQGFDGAQGQVTFDGTDARVPGVLVRWDGAKEVPVENSGS